MKYFYVKMSKISNMSKITGYNKRLKYFYSLFQELRFPIPSIGSETTTKLLENEEISKTALTD